MLNSLRKHASVGGSGKTNGVDTTLKTKPRYQYEEILRKSYLRDGYRNCRCRSVRVLRW